MSWCQGFVGQVNDPLRAGFFPWRNLVGPTGGYGSGVALPGGRIVLLGRLSRTVPGWAPITLPAFPGGVMTLPCQGGARGMRGAVSLTVYTEGRSLGWANIFQGKVWSSREKTASFPGRNVSSCRHGAWEVGGLFPSEEGCTVAGRELLPSPGGRWAIAGLGRLPDAWILGELLPSEEGCTVAGGELLPSPGGRWAMAGVGRLPIAWLARLGWLLITWLLPWGGPVPSRRRWPVARGLSPSLGGRKAVAGVGLQGFAWLTWLLRLLCEFKLFRLVLLNLVIFPSFLLLVI